MHRREGGKDGKVDLLRPGIGLWAPSIAKGLKKHRTDEDQSRVEDREALPTESVLHLLTEIPEHEHLEQEPD